MKIRVIVSIAILLASTMFGALSAYLQSGHKTYKIYETISASQGLTAITFNAETVNMNSHSGIFLCPATDPNCPPPQPPPEPPKEES